MAKIKTINNIKNINNNNFKNNEEIITIQSNDNDINKPFNCKKIILKKKLDNLNYVNNYGRNNNKLLSYNSNNNINSIKNPISFEAFVNINPNINNKNNLFYKNQSKLINKKIYFNRQKFPINIKSNTHSNINIYQNFVDSTSKNLNNNNGSKKNYKLYDSNRNSSRAEKRIRNNNSFLKSYIQNKNLKMITPKKPINKNINTQTISIIDSKVSNKNIENLNNFEKDKSSIYQNKNLRIIYINNNCNYLRNENINVPISHFSTRNIMDEGGKYSLEINQRNKLINLNNINFMNHSPFSINSYNVKTNKNNTYKSIFKRNEGDTSPFSEYISPLYEKYF
jgi:hypothetical protein